MLAGIRPEVWRQGSDLHAEVQTAEPKGKDLQIGFTLAGTKVRALLDGAESIRPGGQAGLSFRMRFVYFFDETSGQRLREVSA